ncbi:MAG: hypothetical protein AAGI37_21105 [Planctomycetota bacterium]
MGRIWHKARMRQCDPETIDLNASDTQEECLQVLAGFLDQGLGLSTHLQLVRCSTPVGVVLTQERYAVLLEAQEKKTSRDAYKQYMLGHGGVDPNAPAWGGAFTLRDEANALVAKAFRNGPLEDLHAGEHSELLNNSSLSRITDPEMKTLMLSACRILASMLQMKEEQPEQYDQEIRRYAAMYCKDWERMVPKNE